MTICFCDSCVWNTPTACDSIGGGCPGCPLCCDCLECQQRPVTAMPVSVVVSLEARSETTSDEVING
jgi:hypothetical protein